MDLKRRIDELSAAVDRLQPSESTPPPAMPRRMTVEEWDDFIAGKPTIFKVWTPIETAYYLKETVDRQFSLTRLGTEESDLEKVAERIRNWKRPEHGFNPFCPHFKGSLKTRPGSTEVMNTNEKLRGGNV
jgi:hypothetical protein